MAHIGCARGELDRAVAAMKNEKEAARKKQLAAEALAVRIKLAGDWAQLLSIQTALTDTPGELGTIANLEMQSRRTRHLLDEYDAELAATLGGPMPDEATPSTNYSGAARIIVPTVRTQVQAGELLHLKVIVLDNEPAKSAALSWRRLGRGGLRKSICSTSAAPFMPSHFRPRGRTSSPTYPPEPHPAGSWSGPRARRSKIKRSCFQRYPYSRNCGAHAASPVGVAFPA